MSEQSDHGPDDRELEDFLEGRSEISRVYAEGAKRQSSPPAADLAIRALAREDLQRVARGGWDRTRYLRPMALAASLVLALGVFLKLRDEPQDPPASSAPARTQARPAAPAPTPDPFPEAATAPEARRAEPQAAAPVIVESDAEAKREAPVVTQPLRSLRDLGAEGSAGAAASGEARPAPEPELDRQRAKPAPKVSPELRARDAPAAAPAPAAPAPPAAGAAAAAPRPTVEAEAAPRRKALEAESLAKPVPAPASERRTENGEEARDSEFFVAPEERKAAAAVPLKGTTSEEQLDEIRAMASNNLPAARTALESWRAANAQAEIPEDLAWLLE